MVRSILVGLGGRGVPGSCYTESATAMAVDLAQRHKASLTGVTVANLTQLARIGPVPIGAGALAADWRDQRVAEMRDHVAAAIVEFERACGSVQLPHKVLREERQEPFDYLISQARYHDLTVIGLRGLFEYGVNGEAHYDPADTLVRLVSGGVRPIIASGPEARPVTRVMVAYSGSPQSAKTMRRFVQMQLWPRAAVRVVAFGDDHERRQRHLVHAAAYFEAHGVEAERDYRPTDPRRGVLEAAHEWGADLIVMGNSHRTLLARKVLGDTLLETIRHSDVPLFLAQ
ncbi:Universal stress protein family protein [Botrimarina colliarenosi]|uniref:Universal stress protein family protein n=1 Tax=Botrimarina colliarenosi TaxID=2528001 RepID=A0A5C6AFJ7_9BACT|nr:universal stress protein [Botrimarina colliarenosi]TWT98197.1 Universal stress protein family protein [Botrimarina colliarenosi]